MPMISKKCQNALKTKWRKWNEKSVRVLKILSAGGGAGAGGGTFLIGILQWLAANAPREPLVQS